MKYLLLLSFLLLGCDDKDLKPAYVNISCLDSRGELTFFAQAVRTSVQIMDDPSKEHPTEVCTIVRVYPQKAQE